MKNINSRYDISFVIQHKNILLFFSIKYKKLQKFKTTYSNSIKLSKKFDTKYVLQ